MTTNSPIATPRKYVRKRNWLATFSYLVLAAYHMGPTRVARHRNACPELSGKELVAKAIHHCSLRKDQPYVTLNCASLNENLLESELFGHKKGAFTGSVEDTPGLFGVADKGTLFLDEIGDAPKPIQVKLLRVLESGEYKRVGDSVPWNTNVRLITATNRDLDSAVKTGKFREYLFFRINVVPIHIPPLRERKKDIPILANHFLIKTAKEQKKRIQFFSKEILEYLRRKSWVGNIRELENFIEKFSYNIPA